jgi:hypothetical protein
LIGGGRQRGGERGGAAQVQHGSSGHAQWMDSRLIFTVTPA